jgi:hypothetical protein
MSSIVYVQMCMNGRCGDGLGLGLIVELLLVALLQISDCNGGERGQVSVVSVVRGSSTLENQR